MKGRHAALDRVADSLLAQLQQGEEVDLESAPPVVLRVVYDPPPPGMADWAVAESP